MPTDTTADVRAIHARIAYDTLALGRLLERHARYRPDHLAVVAPSGASDARLTWRELDRHVDRLAAALAAAGVGRGDRVATLLANSLTLVSLYWACAKLGAAIVPMSPLLNAPGIASLLRDSAPRILVAGDALRRHATPRSRSSVRRRR